MTLSTAKLYWRIVIKPHIEATSVLLGLMVLGGLLEMATVGMGVPLLETAMRSDQAQTNPIILWTQWGLHHFGFSVEGNNILFALLVLVGVVGVMNATVILMTQLVNNWIAKNLYREIKAKLFYRTLRAKVGCFDDKNRGTVLYNITAPSIAIFQVIAAFSKLLASAFNALFLVGLMLYLSWWATVTIGIAGLFWVQGCRRVVDRRSVKVGRQLYDLEALVSKLEVDAVDGFKVVKAYGLESKIADQQEEGLRKQLFPHLRMILLTNGTSFLNEILAAGVIILIGAATLTFHWVNIPFAQLVIFFVALRRVSLALGNVNASYAMLNKEKKNVEVIDEITNSLPLERFGEQPVHTVRALELKDVLFQYSANATHPVLQGIHLTMNRGEITAIVGSTGSGKSTIANLLVGFYQPASGKILVDGTDLSRLDLDLWRKNIGYVSQDIFLFNGSIWDNISLGDPSCKRQEIEEAARLAQLHDHIAALPEGYQTLVGDRGLKLSGGQAQRVAIARAILRKPALLIFDEATSALDNLTEKAIYDSIRALRKNAIVLVIAHRLSTIRDADHICVLEAGKIVEQGKHESLVQLKGVYTNLYQGGEAYAAN